MNPVWIKEQWSGALGLVLGLAISAGAHFGDRVYPIVELTDEMLAEIRLDDGSVDEWFDLVGEPSMTLLDFGSLIPHDPSNLDFRIWLAWTDEPPRFYVAFVGSDDVYQNTHDYNVSSTPTRDIIDNDSITPVIDGDHSGGAGCPGNCSLEEWAEIRETSQPHDVIARTVSGPTLDDWWTRADTGKFPWTVLPPYGHGGGGVVGVNPTISVIEFYVTPFDRWGL